MLFFSGSGGTEGCGMGGTTAPETGAKWPAVYALLFCAVNLAVLSYGSTFFINKTEGSILWIGGAVNFGTMGVSIVGLSNL